MASLEQAMSGFIPCPCCGSTHPEGTSVCITCGYALAGEGRSNSGRGRCARCGSSMPTRYDFCPVCGLDQRERLPRPATGALRLLTPQAQSATLAPGEVEAPSVAHEPARPVSALEATDPGSPPVVGPHGTVPGAHPPTADEPQAVRVSDGPERSTPPDAMPPGATPPGAMPPGTTPPGATPPGAMPPGATPPGAAPAAAVAHAAVDRAAPGGTMPPGAVHTPPAGPEGWASDPRPMSPGPDPVLRTNTAPVGSGNTGMDLVPDAAAHTEDEMTVVEPARAAVESPAFARGPAPPGPGLAATPGPVDPALASTGRAVELGGAAARRPAPAARVVVVSRDGTEGESFSMDGDQLVIGRTRGHIQFADDGFLAPEHARLQRTERGFLLVDMGTRNGAYLRIARAEPVFPGDLFLIGHQLLRLENLDGSAQEEVNEPDGTRIFGTPVQPAWGRVCILGRGGIEGDVHFLRGPEVVFGREAGDVLFPADPFLSRQHARLRLELSGQTMSVFLEDLGSANGSYMRVRGSAPLLAKDMFRVGDQILRLRVD